MENKRKNKLLSTTKNSYEDRKEFRKNVKYHHKDPPISSIIYPGVGLSSWSYVAMAYGNTVIPTLTIISHNLNSCSFQRHRRERDGEFQKARRNFGHACHETLTLPRTESLVRCTTQVVQKVGHLVALCWCPLYVHHSCCPHRGAG